MAAAAREYACTQSWHTIMMGLRAQYERVVGEAEGSARTSDLDRA
jgi:hypothetical protein